MRKRIKLLEGAIEKAQAKVISIDVFDTLLLRTVRPELLRFKDFSHCQAQLSFFNEGVKPEDLYIARLKAGKYLYDKARRGMGEFEVTYKAIFEMIFSMEDCLKKIDRGVLQSCLKLELEQEKKQLSPCLYLSEFLKRQQSRGREIVYCSDMYLDAKSIGFLLKEILGDDLYGQVIVSSDWQKTKRHGSLFKEMLIELGIVPGQLFHIGDNLRSDVFVPQSLGINTMYWPRSYAWRISSTIWKKSYDCYLKSKA
ncbi:hypothetical protein [Kiloniella antarctica]|uniref:HAD family hydrolase n=1 Tax=Kiloniella antarctica TaxID=1550907 RepID=A0ABW5BSZ7_9PROT